VAALGEAGAPGASRVGKEQKVAGQENSTGRPEKGRIFVPAVTERLPSQKGTEEGNVETPERRTSSGINSTFFAKYEAALRGGYDFSG
jgi:hypothetical protein